MKKNIRIPYLNNKYIQNWKETVILNKTDKEYNRIKFSNIISYNTQFKELNEKYTKKLDDLEKIFGKSIADEYRNIEYFIKMNIIINQITYRCNPIMKINKLYNNIINNIIDKLNNKNIYKSNGIKETPIKKTDRIVEKLLIVQKNYVILKILLEQLLFVINGMMFYNY